MSSVKAGFAIWSHLPQCSENWLCHLFSRTTFKNWLLSLIVPFCFLFLFRQHMSVLVSQDKNPKGRNYSAKRVSWVKTFLTFRNIPSFNKFISALHNCSVVHCSLTLFFGIGISVKTVEEERSLVALIKLMYFKSTGLLFGWSTGQIFLI